MGQKKLIRFEAIKTFPNVLQYPGGMAGQWKAFFRNDNPLTLELACGKGEYTVGLARMYPHRNFLGVDLKGNRIYIGAKKSLQEHLSNAAFLRTQIDAIHTYFAPGEVEEIWLTFPDPQLRKSKARKRLTHPRFLRLYQQFLIPGGLIHLKTDSPVLYDFTRLVIDLYKLPLIEASDDIYKGPIKDELAIRTHYEGLDIAKSQRVHYLCFALPASPLPQSDDILQQKLKEEGQSEGDFYYNEMGYVVFTEKYHLGRGYCCGNGCKHCPYDYENVPEPKRSLLRSQKNRSSGSGEKT